SQVPARASTHFSKASFRFGVTSDTLAFGYALPTIGARWGLAPVRLSPCRANKIKQRALDFESKALCFL
ncbi:MAG: hypothetical protein HDS42_07285, partial [Bacteroides sp.]|nr:hypothetical protein [Bacteroides sp.]